MRSFAVPLIAILMPFAASAHEDRVLPIAVDGTIQGLPEHWAPMKLDLRTDASRAITSVVLSAPKFKTKLNRCLIDLMKTSALTEVSARGSWHHEPGLLPPYITLEIRRKGEDPMLPADNAIEVVISMDDGSVVSGVRRWTTWWGGQRSNMVEKPAKCSNWR